MTATMPITPVQAANIWYVDPSGTDDGSHGTGPGAGAFKTIQYAINDARVLGGDTINVAAGTYTENIVINKGVTLRGAGSGTDPSSHTLIVPANGDPIVRVNGPIDGLIIEDLRLSDDSSGSRGILMTSDAGVVSHITLQNIAIDVLDVAVHVESKGGSPISSIVVTGSIITSQWANGIFLSAIGGSSLSQVTITGDTKIYGSNADWLSGDGVRMEANGAGSSISEVTISGVEIVAKAGNGVVAWCGAGGHISDIEVTGGTIDASVNGVSLSASNPGSLVSQVTIGGDIQIMSSANGVSADATDGEVSHIAIEASTLQTSLAGVSLTSYGGVISDVTVNGVTMQSTAVEYPFNGLDVNSNGGGSSISRVTVKDSAITSYQFGVYLSASDEAGSSISAIHIIGSTITGSTMAGLNTGFSCGPVTDVIIHLSCIHNNGGYGVLNDELSNIHIIDASNNWWGSGGTGAEKGKPGVGGNNGVSDNVDYTPWLVPGTEQQTGTATGTGTAKFNSNVGAVADPTPIDEATLPTAGKPNLNFPHGFFSFYIAGLTPGATVTVTITLPSAVPVGTQYWKYHASEGGWIQIPMGSDNGDNVITITLVDGGLGDDDGLANGIIDDQGGPGNPPPPKPVGGEVYPVDKLALLAPYIAAILVIATTAVVVKKRRH